MSVEKLIEQPIQKEAEKNQKPIFSFEEPEYLKEHPVISRETLTIGDHSIEFINQNPNVQLDEKHLSQAREVLERIYSFAPELVKNYEKIFIVHDPHAEEKAKDPYSFAPNAKNIQSLKNMELGTDCDGICINQYGFQIDKPHRVEKINNFQGTLAHETAHGEAYVEKYKYKKGGDKGILYKFQEELGYHPIFLKDEWIKEGKFSYCQPISGWEAVKTKAGGLKGYINKESGYFTSWGWAPEDLKSVPTKYAQLKPEEDFCDSFVAYLFAPETLDPKRIKFFEEHYPQKTDIKNKK